MSRGASRGGGRGKGRAAALAGHAGGNGARPRVLVVGDAVAPTGFARVLHSILGRLCDSYEFHHLGINYAGTPTRCANAVTA